MARQATTKQSDSTHKNLISSKRIKEGVLTLFLSVGVFLLLSLVTYNQGDPSWSNSGLVESINNAGGKAGAYFSDIFFYTFGYPAFLFPVLLIYAIISLYFEKETQDKEWISYITKTVGLVFMIVGTCGLASVLIQTNTGYLPFTTGGVIGELVGLSLYSIFNKVGATLILSALVLSGVTLLTGLSWVATLEQLGLLFYKGLGLLVEGLVKLFSRLKEIEFKSKKEPKIHATPIITQPMKTPTKASIQAARRQKPEIGEIAKPKNSKRYDKDRQAPLFNNNVDSEGLPPLSLLDPNDTEVQGFTNESLERMSREVEQRLAEFGITVQVVAVHPGPVITRFEMELAPGVKASRITALSRDLARSLSVVSVRVVEVIPGKSVVGLELPNENRAIVRLSEVLGSEAYEQSKSPISLALGKDISGNPIVVDLAKMPHLLVAGTTGSGKSVGVNAMILSILYKSSPKDVRLILIDPKMLELSVYDDIPHLLAPVVTDMKEAAGALRWCVNEMERRYKLLAKLGVRNVSGFNKKVTDAIKAKKPIPDPLFNAAPDEKVPTLETLPFVVVVIDEFADMMMVVGKKVEQLIARIAQKARAAGIHLILATQRPSVDVITGLIKSNIPTRIGFQVSSKIDSRTILDQSGAEQLLGHGDMLYLQSGMGTPIRVHGAFVDDHEVHKVAENWRARGKPQYINEILDTDFDAGDIGGQAGADDELDSLFDEAVRFVTESQKASISSVQRKFRIGYNRAARIIESMELHGIVTPMETSGSREVLAPPPVTVD